ncbi:MAG: L,D-transpeptidase family protein [Pseudomonadota bacterium]
MKPSLLNIGVLALGLCLGPSLAGRGENRYSLATNGPQTNGDRAVETSTSHPAPAAADIDKVLTADAVIVEKSERKLRLLHGGAVIATFGVGLGPHPQGTKTQQGDGRTPEGDYVLDWRNPQSRFHLSIHISYPNAADRAQAAARGVSPGGDIFVHGTPWLDNVDGFDWTNGCIAVTNADMDAIWAMVPDGTPITILP